MDKTKSSIAPTIGPERRHYPRDLEGGKNEWKALVKHYEEYDMKANVLENYAKNIIQNQRKNELEEQREAERRRKKEERERELAYERSLLEMNRLKEEELKIRESAAKKTIQQTLADEYKKEMEAKRAETQAEAERLKNFDANQVQQIIHDTDPKTIEQQMVKRVLSRTQQWKGTQKVE